MSPVRGCEEAFRGWAWLHIIYILLSVVFPGVCARSVALKAATIKLPTVQPPFHWKHANLEPVFLFLVKEIEAGRYVPAFDFP